MNWNSLSYVIEIARQRSFSKAAKELYIAQPSLSQSIRALENELGTPLFDRTGSPVKLTYAGELFVSWANEALRTREQTLKQIYDLSQGMKTKLVVGVSFSRSAYLFPNIMAEFRRLRPNCTVRLIEQPTSLLSEDDDLDLLIDVPRDGSATVTSITLAEERIMLAIPGNISFPAIQKKEDFPVIELSDFSQYPFIVLSEDQMLRKVCFSLCAQQGFTPQIAMECRSLQTAYSMVEAGVGVTVIPELFAKHLTVGNAAYRCVIGKRPTVRKIAAIYRNDRYLTEDARVLIDLLQKML